MNPVPRLESFDQRIPQWAGGDLVQRPCPVCDFAGPHDPFVIRPDGLTVVSCPSCGLRLVNPCPGGAALGGFYSRYGSVHRRLTYTESDAKEILREPQWRWREDARMNGLMKTGGVAGKKLLDVGCSRGDFLLATKGLGAFPVGLEMDRNAAEFVRHKLRIPVLQGDAEEVELNPEEFDCITCWDLIEHLRSPRTAVQNLIRALKPGGRIAFWTPNADLIDQWATDWIGFRVDLEHLQYFSSRSLCSLLRRAGAEPIRIEAVGFPALKGIFPGGPTRPHALIVRLRRSRLVAKSARTCRWVKKKLLPSPVEELEQKYPGYHLLVIAARAG